MSNFASVGASIGTTATRTPQQPQPTQVAPQRRADNDGDNDATVGDVRTQLAQRNSNSVNILA